MASRLATVPRRRSPAGRAPSPLPAFCSRHEIRCLRRGGSEQAFVLVPSRSFGHTDGHQFARLVLSLARSFFFATAQMIRRGGGSLFRRRCCWPVDQLASGAIERKRAISQAHRRPRREGAAYRGQ